MEGFELIVLFCEFRVKVGSVDVDHCSLVLLINDVIEIIYKRYRLHHEQLIIKAIVPWLREKRVLETYIDYIDHVLKSLDKGIDIVKLGIDILALNALPPLQQIETDAEGEFPIS